MKKKYTLSTVSGMKQDTMELIAESMEMNGEYLVFTNCSKDGSIAIFPEFYIKQHVIDLIMVENQDD